jgi:hypothetical protein
MAMTSAEHGDGGLLVARKAVRDLLWAVTSPHMVSDTLYPVLPRSMGDEALRTARARRWLAALDADPRPLLSFLQGACPAVRLPVCHLTCSC